MGRAFPEGRYVAIERGTGLRWLLGSRVLSTEVVVYDQDGKPGDGDDFLGEVVQRFPAFGQPLGVLEHHGWEVDRDTAVIDRRRLRRPFGIIMVRPLGSTDAAT